MRSSGSTGRAVPDHPEHLDKDLLPPATGRAQRQRVAAIPRKGGGRELVIKRADFYVDEGEPGSPSASGCGKSTVLRDARRGS